MALKATIFKAELNVADLERDYYQTHQLTIARHPSETDARMMARLLAFAHNASERLVFTRGISTDDEPDIWQKDLSDAIELWVELGQPEEKRVRKACGRSARVRIYGYSTRAAQVWWDQNAGKLKALDNLAVYQFDPQAIDTLAAATERSMVIHCTLQDGEILTAMGEATVGVSLQQRLG